MSEQPTICKEHPPIQEWNVLTKDILFFKKEDGFTVIVHKVVLDQLQLIIVDTMTNIVSTFKVLKKDLSFYNLIKTNSEDCVLTDRESLFSILCWFIRTMPSHRGGYTGYNRVEYGMIASHTADLLTIHIMESSLYQLYKGDRIKDKFEPDTEKE